MNILELKKNLLSIINDKYQIILDRLNNLEQDYQTFKTRELKRDLDIENKLNNKIDTKLKLLENKINDNFKFYKNNIKKINEDLDKKIEDINQIFNKKFSEILEKNYDKEIKEIKKMIQDLKKQQEKLNNEFIEIKNILL